MDLKIGSIVKAIMILIGLYLGSDVISETQMDQVAGALSVFGAVGYDLYETWKLHRQGVTSTESADNDDKKMAKVKLVDEKTAKEKSSS